jgi:DNA invertase Pin-like site-specific DNA recombinase
MTGKFVSYLRVSTQKQGRSGLGLEAQRHDVETYLNGGRWKLIQELVEVESGKRSDNRPQLQKALSLCRIHRATLVVAKLDRLARNVAFISALMEAGVEFVACDMPAANKMTIHVMAAMAEQEARAISARTIAALAAAKARGKVLGGKRELRRPEGEPADTPRVEWNVASVADKGRAEGLLVRRKMRDRFLGDILPMIQDKQRQGMTQRQIAESLNADDAKTPRGGRWSSGLVCRVLKTAQ